MTPSLLHCTRSRPTNGLWLGLCLSLDAQTQTHTHADKHTLIHAWVCISTNVYRRDCTRKKTLCLLLLPLPLTRSACKQKAHQSLDGWRGRAEFNEREKKTKMCGLRLSHPSLHPSAHMTATPKYGICFSQHGEMRNEAEMKKCNITAA